MCIFDLYFTETVAQMLFRTVMAIYDRNYTIQYNTISILVICGEDTEFSNVKSGRLFGNHCASNGTLKVEVRLTYY
jgi:hypothetical protein